MKYEPYVVLVLVLIHSADGRGKAKICCSDSRRDTNKKETQVNSALCHKTKVQLIHPDFESPYISLIYLQSTYNGSATSKVYQEKWR